MVIGRYSVPPSDDLIEFLSSYWKKHEEERSMKGESMTQSIPNGAIQLLLKEIETIKTAWVSKMSTSIEEIGSSSQMPHIGESIVSFKNLKFYI